MRSIFVTTIVGLMLVGCSSKKEAPLDMPLTAEATMKSQKLKKLDGKVSFEARGDGVFMVANVSGLTPNSNLGFHIHEFGKCEGPDYKSAGNHLNPYQHQHAGPTDTRRHLGDLGNLVVDGQGRAVKELLLSNDPKDLELINGKALIIHAKRDDLKTQPTGNSGDRIACGLIKIEE